MKILYLITSIDRGGAENYTKDLCTSMADLGNSVYLGYFKGNAYWENELKKRGVKVFTIGRKFLRKNIIFNFFLTLYWIFFLIRFIKKNNFDIVHSNLPLMEIIGSIVIFFLGNKPKFIITKHLDNFYLQGSRTSDNKKNFFIGIFFEKLIIQRANKIIAISKSVKNFCLKNFNISVNKIVTIYYGLEVKKKKNNLSKKTYIKNFSYFKKKPNELIMGSVSRLVEQKNIQLILKALSILKKRNYIFKFYFLGDGPLLNKLQNLSKEYCIDKNVFFLGHSPNVSFFYKFLDVFCLSSNYEGFGMVLLEAMSEKVPIIATRSSAIPEVVPEDMGLLFKKNNTNDLVKKMIIFYNAKKRKLYSERAYSHFLKFFSLEKSVREVLKIYNLELNNEKK